MKRVFLTLAYLLLAACGGGGNNLAPNEGGILTIVEMPAAGTPEGVVQLQVRITDLQGQEIAEPVIFDNEALNLETGRWPQATGTCVSLRENIPGEEVPQNFLPADSSCITFSLVKSFEVGDPGDDELFVSMEIRAVNGVGAVITSIIHSVVFERGVFLGDPALATSVDDLAPYIATLAIE